MHDIFPEDIGLRLGSAKSERVAATLSNNKKYIIVVLSYIVLNSDNVFHFVCSINPQATLKEISQFEYKDFIH